MCSTKISVQCKMFCMKRSLNAIVLSILMELLLLELSLLLMNFSLIHPVQWISLTLSMSLSVNTWLKLLAIAIIVSFYGVLLSKSVFMGKKFYRTRFQWLIGTTFYKVTLCLVSAVIGVITTWLYTNFLSGKYRELTSECYENECLNKYFVFLISSGAMTGIYFFYKSLLFIDPDIEFPIIEESTWVKVRNLLYTTIYNALLTSLKTTFVFMIVYSVIGDIINRPIATLIGVNMDFNQSTFTWICDSRLIFYTWILSAQIISSLRLLQHLLSICLVQNAYFAVEEPGSNNNKEDHIISLIDALAASQIPVIQTLAAMNLYNISKSKLAEKRRPIFSLSLPGGHPYNWTQISGQCISMIESFTEDLSLSAKNISSLKTTPLYEMTCTSAKEAADKILLRQYNATFGIRQMAATENTVNQSAQTVETKTYSHVINQRMEQISQQIDHVVHHINSFIRNSIRAIPGVIYLFGEQDGAKTTYLLSNSRTIVWLTQGLAGICTKSIVEDKFGIIQSSLPDIIRVLLKLKNELDKLNNVNFNGKKLDRNFVTLKNAIKRSLYKICSVFGDYLRDIVEDPRDFRSLQEFVCYLE